MPNALSEKIRIIQKYTDASSREVAQMLDTTPETISRWSGGKNEPQPKYRDNLLQLEWLAEQLSELYRPDQAKLWLFSPNRQLAGARPVDLIAEGRSEEVLKIIAQLKDGAFI